tara:strand:+ start:2251 stop:2694 length:444 start_codon:yes stop_codon:yes gene_type:complete
MISTLLTELTANARLSAMMTVRSIVRMVVLSLAALLAALGMVIYLANAVHRLLAERYDAVTADLTLAGGFLALLVIIMLLLGRRRRRVVVRRPLAEPPAAAAPLAGPGAGAGLFAETAAVWPPKKPVVFGLMFTAMAIGFGVGRRKG